MSAPRLSGVADDAAGRLLLVGLGTQAALFPADRVLAVESDIRAHDALGRLGLPVATAPEGRFDAAVVALDRARDRSRARLALAAAALPPGAPLWVDGQKEDGIEAMLRELRELAPVGEVVSRGHGKLIPLTVPSGDWLPAAWNAAAREVAPGFVTRPGVFSADGIDPGSALLAAALPPRLPARVVDLGAGWGWLGAQVLARAGVEALHLVEADADALACARENIDDPRAQFHWADATTFSLPEPVGAVVMNPPFHEGRASRPALGAGFIAAAARLLSGAGRLWMVANRGLPYEAALGAAFREVVELGGDARFKVIEARQPRARAVPGRQPQARPMPLRRRMPRR